MKNHLSGFTLVLFFLLWELTGCVPKKELPLPILGNKEFISIDSSGILITDTVYHTIPDFEFYDQDSVKITLETFRDKIYVADFFFTSCPTICPVMKTQMLRVYEEFLENEEVLFLSHTIDPDYDSVPVLKEFAERLEVSSKKWHFVTGRKEDIFRIGQNSYMVTAADDPNEPGGYLHSGHFILVDKQKRIRGLYDGTDPVQVNRLMNDLRRLLASYDQK
jgi:protein SCO1/2